MRARSLTTRLVAISVALIAVVSMLVTALTAVVMHSYLTARVDQDLRRVLERQPGRGGPPPGQVEPDALGDRIHGPRPDRLPGAAPGTILVIVGAAGSTGSVLTEGGVSRPLNKDDLDVLDDVAPGAPVRDADLSLGGYRVAAVARAGTTTVVGFSTRRIADTVQSLVARSAALTLLGCLGAGLLGSWLVRRALRPLREVAATAHEVSSQQLATGEPRLAQRVDARYTDAHHEVGRVGLALNTMLDHVDDALGARHRSEQQVRQFVADASHELRTPLSTIAGYAELSRRTPDDAAALGSAMAKVEIEAGRMSGLVEDLLLLARLDAGRPLARQPVDLTRLLLEAVSDARVVAPSHHWRLALPEHPVMVEGDEQRLHQVVTNLLGNARKHTPPGTTVTVSATVGGDQARMAVRDDGPGLASDLVGRAFERFTRGDSSRTRASGGAGLGLSLVAAIAAAHGGTAAVTSEPGSTTFTVTLPRTRPAT